ncbi:MAG: hypothetical protein NTV28_09885 [Propionibacteriales bacterium]|nr:hypothetical protein [Propionibacteriales bacterium]
MDEIWFDERDDAAELVKALEAEGYVVTARAEGFAGEDDSEDRAWAVVVEPFDERVVDMVDVYGGWLPGDPRRADTAPPSAPDLPTAPKRLKREQ